jgi:hypothetical protein
LRWTTEQKAGRRKNLPVPGPRKRKAYHSISALPYFFFNFLQDKAVETTAYQHRLIIANPKRAAIISSVPDYTQQNQ